MTPEQWNLYLQQLSGKFGNKMQRFGPEVPPDYTQLGRPIVLSDIPEEERLPSYAAPNMAAVGGQSVIPNTLPKQERAMVSSDWWGSPQGQTPRPDLPWSLPTWPDLNMERPPDPIIQKALQQDQPSGTQQVAQIATSSSDTTDKAKKAYDIAKAQAEDKVRTDKLNRLGMFRDISESLGNIKFHATPVYMSASGDASPGRDIALSQPPYINEGLREQISRTEDTLTDAERAQLGDMLGGKELPPGMTFSQLKTIAPPIAQSLRNLEAGTERLQARRLKIHEDFQKDTKDDRDALEQADRARILLSQKTWSGDFEGIIQSLKSAGLKGRITYYEVKNLTAQKGILQRIENAYSLWTQNKLSEQARKDLLQAVNALGEGAKRSIAQKEGEHARLNSELYGTTSQDLQQRLHSMSPGDAIMGGQTGGKVNVRIQGEGDFSFTKEQADRLIKDNPGKATLIP